jgi:hypothetical protein
MSSYYVYLLMDTSKETPEPFYVGKGTKKRMFIHFNQAKSGKCLNKFLENKIKKLWAEGKDIPINVVFETANEDDAFMKEIEIIETVGRRDLQEGPLLNLTNGGDGVKKPSLESVGRMIETKNKWSEERKQEVANKKRISMENFWNSITDGERKTYSNHGKSYFENMTTSEKETYRKKCAQRHNDAQDNDAFKEKLKKASRKRWDAIDINTLVEHGEKIKAGQEKMTKEDKDQLSSKRKTNTKKRWESMSQDQRAEFSRKMKEAAKKRWSNGKSEK